MNDCVKVHQTLVERGAQSIKDPTIIEDKNGIIVKSTIKAFGDITHSFIERKNFKGFFLPNFQDLEESPMNIKKGIPKYEEIDHITSDHEIENFDKVISFYENVMKFHKYKSVDEPIIEKWYI